MFVFYKNVKFTGVNCSVKKVWNMSKTICECICQRQLSDISKKFVTFDAVNEQRRKEAARSVVVQVNAESSFNGLYGYCSKYAEVRGIHHYKNSSGENFMLIEFTSEENLRDVLETCASHQKNIDVMASESPFLWFRAVSGKKEKPIILKSISLATKDGNSKINDEELLESLSSCEDLSAQIQMLHDKTVLNDLGVRLRFMVARQLEVIFKSLYANVAVRPFGSSVNGFGKMGCDLDLSLTNVLTDEMTDNSKRLVYQEKKCENGRSPWHRHMELVAELLELRVPGAVRVLRILQARVPIVKYTHEVADLDCDLCYNNMSGVYMSELLWQLAELDERVRPLVGVVRRWARAAELTSPHPGRWITNFPLTLMVLFFLQQNSREGAILPSLKYLVNKSDEEDMRITDDNVNCTFLRDLNKLPSDSYGQSSADLGTLLLQFFEFYSQFNFRDQAISLNEGKPVRKPNALPLYVVNPLEQSLNVSRNVSYEECERFKTEVKNAAWLLEAQLEGRRSNDWGLLVIIEKKSTRNVKNLVKVGVSHRLVSVKDLFNVNEEKLNTEDLKSKLNRLTIKTNGEIEDSVKEMKNAMVKEVKKEQKMRFKTNQVANEVNRIRRNKMV